jgi:hypothetical protein
MQILQVWNALPKQTILLEAYTDPSAIKVFSKHPTLPPAILYDSGSGPSEVTVEHFRRLIQHNVNVYYDGVDMKIVIADKLTSLLEHNAI